MRGLGGGDEFEPCLFGSGFFSKMSDEGFGDVTNSAVTWIEA